MHFSELQILKFSRSHTLSPMRQWRVEGAEAPYYITLTATPFHSPSTAKFGENPAGIPQLLAEATSLAKITMNCIKNKDGEL